MKRLMLLAAVVLAAVPMAADANEWGYVLSDEVRDHELVSLDGDALTLADLEGEVVVLNFWASWCAPCRKELPELQRLHDSIREDAGRVVAVSVDQKRRNVEDFIDDEGLSLPVVHDGTDGLAKMIDLPSLPFTMVVSREGEVIYVSGRSDSEAIAQLVDVVDEQLAMRPEPATLQVAEAE